jgi:hypothetical protein
LIPILAGDRLRARRTKTRFCSVEPFQRPAVTVADVFTPAAFALSGGISAEKSASLQFFMGDQSRLEFRDSLLQADVARPANPGSGEAIFDARLQMSDQSAVAEDLADSATVMGGVSILVDSRLLDRAEADLGAGDRLGIRACLLVEHIAALYRVTGSLVRRMGYMRCAGPQWRTVKKVFEVIADSREHVTVPRDARILLA